ncbi:GGDEF domain-containing protein [Scandinavium goeteborgense]|uniref:GGDEF domain-containing protein n=1 Tax=Scandinavium goeteborgense TaxID=1851514 RepID=UPI000F672304|nr:GGDEF domain-containing protein [Scandinavium goeteborgense]QKN81147.1 GGDEF domain-containing protein [Scandinavium goeteborgense]
MNYSEKIVQEWMEFSCVLPEPALVTLTAIAEEKAGTLADEFYDIMLTDPHASAYISSDVVQSRLRNSMKKWIINALTLKGEELLGFAAHQYEIGNIHSRVGIPASLVLKGMRIITQEMLTYIQSLELEPKTSVLMQKYVSVSIQIASELMTYAYENYQLNEAKNEESYRISNLIDNPELEKGKQQAALFNWENGLIYALVSRTSNIQSYLLNDSEFGLWFRHKCGQHFGNQPEISKIGMLIQEIDGMLQKTANTEGSALEYIQSLLSDIRAKTMIINNLFTSLFEDATRLENGKDALTKLLNRRFMSTILKHEVKLVMENGRNLSVVMLDIDHFKKINDTWGHSAGDEVLRHLATILTDSTRASDYVFRYGGEEFMIVYLEYSKQQTLNFVESIREKIFNSPCEMPDGYKLQLSASFGVSHYRGHPDYQKLVDEADKALYEAKNTGRNKVVEFKA